MVGVEIVGHLAVAGISVKISIIGETVSNPAFNITDRTSCRICTVSKSAACAVLTGNINARAISENVVRIFIAMYPLHENPLIDQA